MRGSREISAFIGLLIVYVLQTSAIARLDLPLGGPNLIFVFFLAWTLRHEALSGALIGFIVGLLMDFAPPGSATAGVWMIVLTAVGYGVGAFATRSQDLRNSPVVAWMVVVAGLMSIFIGRFVIGISIGEAQLNLLAFFKLVLGGLLWNSLLAPLALWLSSRLYITLGSRSEALR